MSAEATKTVIVTCLACKAVTKVAGIPESKETIRCPKCKQEVSLSLAKPVKEKQGRSREVRPTNLPQPTAADYQRAYNKNQGKRRRGLWLGVLIGAGTSLLVAAVVLTFFVPWQTDTGSPRQVSRHVALLEELNRLYVNSASEMDRLSAPTEILAYNAGHTVVSKQLTELNEEYGKLPVAAKEDLNAVLDLESSLAANKRRYQEARQRLAKLLEGVDPLAPKDTASKPPEATTTADATQTSPEPTGTPSRGTGKGSSLVITSPNMKEPEQPPVATRTTPEPTVPTDEKEKVTLTILNLPKEKVTTEFLARLQRLAGARARVLNRQWAGDLLVIELGAVADLDRFAARLSFGQVTQLDKKQRTITLLARAESVAEDGSLPNLPVEPIDAALAQLQSSDQDKRRRGSLDLLQIKIEPGREEVIEALIAALGDSDLQVRVNAIKALPRWAGAEAVDPLLTQLTDTTPLVWRTALDQLGQLREPRAAEAIVRDCLEKDREPASLALQNLGPKAEPAVLPLLKHEKSEMRLEACRILRRIGTRAAIPELLKITEGQRSPLTETAWEAIEAIANRKG